MVKHERRKRLLQRGVPRPVSNVLSQVRSLKITTLQYDIEDDFTKREFTGGGGVVSSKNWMTVLVVADVMGVAVIGL